VISRSASFRFVVVLFVVKKSDGVRD
jgi:hypothetical protein